MPSLIKSTRLALLAAAVEWVTMRMVWLRSLISSKTSSKAADDLESRAPVGSSARRISGSGDDGAGYCYTLFLTTRNLVRVFLLQLVDTKILSCHHQFLHHLRNRSS